MKIYTLILFCLILIGGVVSATTPERLSGEVFDLYCGDLSKYKKGELGAIQSDNMKNKPIDGDCIFFVDTGKTKYAIKSSSNSWVRNIVPSGESHTIAIGRTANFRSCNTLDANDQNQVKKGEMPTDLDYLDCYGGHTYLDIPQYKLRTLELIEGNYHNKRGDKAEVNLNLIDPGDLFKAPIFEIEIEYTNRDNKDAYITISTDKMLWHNNIDRPYFAGSYSGDCTSPDCFHTDGIIRLIEKSAGGFTLFLEFENYNNSPSEYGEEYDFTDSTYLSKIK